MLDNDKPSTSFVSELEACNGTSSSSISLQQDFGRNIANPKVSIRSKEIKNLREWIQSNPLVSDAVLRKISYGLFYAMWLCDNEIKQEDLAVIIAKFVSYFDPVSQEEAEKAGPAYSYLVRFSDYPGYAFVYAFTLILQIQWPKLDIHRLDKFYFLIKEIMKASFRVATAAKTSADRATFLKTLSVLYKVLMLDPKTPGAIKYYFLEQFIPCLSLLGREKAEETLSKLEKANPNFDADEFEPDDILEPEELQIFLDTFIDIYTVYNMSSVIREKISTCIIGTLIEAEMYHFNYNSAETLSEHPFSDDEIDGMDMDDESDLELYSHMKPDNIDDNRDGGEQDKSEPSPPEALFLNVDWEAVQNKITSHTSKPSLPANVKDLLDEINSEIVSMVKLISSGHSVDKLQEDAIDNSNVTLSEDHEDFMEDDEDDEEDIPLSFGSAKATRNIKTALSGKKITIKNILKMASMDLDVLITSHGRAKLDAFIESLVLAGLYSYQDLTRAFVHNFVNHPKLKENKVNLVQLINTNNKLTVDEIFDIFVSLGLAHPELDILACQKKVDALRANHPAFKGQLTLEQYMERLEYKKIKCIINCYPAPGLKDIIEISPKLLKRLINDLVLAQRPKGNRPVDFGNPSLLASNKKVNPGQPHKKKSVEIDLLHNRVLEFNKKASIAAAGAPYKYDPKKVPAKSLLRKKSAYTKS